MSSELKNRIRESSIWVMVFFAASQVLRLASNLVVTRLLMPEMFGVMALIMVLIQGLTMFSDVGLWAFIVSNKHGIKDKYINTAWAIQIMRGWLIFIVMLIISTSLWFINNVTEITLSGVYGHEQLPELIAIVGIIGIISGYKSMAPAIVSRDIKRFKLEAIELFSQFTGVSVMLLWAWIYPNIWALAVGAIVTAATNTIVTDLVFKYRHKLVVDRDIFLEIMKFGKWIVFSSIFSFMSIQGDKILFAYYLSAEELGVYSIAFLLAMSLSTLVQSMTSKIYFPLFSRIVANDKGLLGHEYYKARFKLDIIVGGTAGFLMSSGVTIIEILYDERYHEAGWMLQVLSLSLIGVVISSLSLNLMTSVGVTRIWAKYNFIRTIFVFIALPVMFNFSGILGSVIAVSASVFMGLPVIYKAIYAEGIFRLKNELFIFIPVLLGYFFGQIFISIYGG